MKNIIFSFVFFAFLTSCGKEEFVSSQEQSLEKRAVGTVVRVTNLDNSVSNYDSPNTKVDQDSDDGFLVTLNYGKISAFTIPALQVVVIEEEDKLTIIKNPGSYQTTYTEQTQVVFTEENNSYLKAVMTPGGNANGISFIIIDDTEGF